MTEKFNGFILPETNYFSLPNNWTDITHGIKSLAELKVIEYVLRHTWGYNGQEDRPKKITMDEFSKGRKRRDGTRMDKGTGLSLPSIRDGLSRAVDHGFLFVQEDKRDLGRIKRYYSLVMSGMEEPTPEFGEEETDDLLKESLPQVNESRPRSEKDTYRKTPKERKRDTAKAGPHSPNGFFPSDEKTREKKPKTQLSPFDVKAGSRLKKMLQKHKAETGRSRVDTLAKQIHRLRTEGGMEEKRIRDGIKWLWDHYSDEYAPRIFKAADVVTKWEKIEYQMKISSNGNGRQVTRQNMHEEWNLDSMGMPLVVVDDQGKQHDGKIAARVRNKLFEFGENVRMTQEMVDVALMEMGLKPGSLPASAVPR